VGIDISTPDPVLVRVSNQGAVPPSVRSNFFEKYTTFGKKGGTGLGTYSAQLAARTMGYGPVDGVL
jgi:hypothetical protein